MRWIPSLTILLAAVGLSLSLVWANPAMIPDHPGHPMKELKDPVTGMSLANDPGQMLWTGSEALEKAAVFHDEQSVQSVTGDPSLQSQGAGVLPKTKGYPEYRIEPTVKEAINPNQ